MIFQGAYDILQVRGDSSTSDTVEKKGRTRDISMSSVLVLKEVLSE